MAPTEREHRTICTNTIGYVWYRYIGYAYLFSETWTFSTRITYGTTKSDQNCTCIADIYLEITHNTLRVRYFRGCYIKILVSREQALKGYQYFYSISYGC